jgi:hypothetical protein
MSWWKTGNGDDRVGDESADAAGNALDTVAATRRGQGRPLPTLEEFVDALATALLFHFELGTLPPVVARRDDGKSVRASAARTAAGDIVAPLLEAIRRMGEAYEAYFDRPPRPSEVVASVGFVLSAAPGDYLGDGAGLSFRLGIDGPEAPGPAGEGRETA